MGLTMSALPPLPNPPPGPGSRGLNSVDPASQASPRLIAPPAGSGNSSSNPRERAARQKARLQALRDRAKSSYVAGAPGLQVASLLCEMVDQMILELFGEALSGLDVATRNRIAQSTSLVAVGGSGRGELCPYSDSDLLFLMGPDTPAIYQECVAQLVRDCWDAGIKLGHSVRTLRDALHTACEDVQFSTSLVDARHLWGSERLTEQLKERYYRNVRRRRSRFFSATVQEREHERQQHGNSARQLEPDVKRGSGGLRDIHSIRWTGFIRFGTGELDLLRLQSALSREDEEKLVEAHEFLTRIRFELHYSAGRAQEVLSRGEQLRLAELYGFHDQPGQRGVEQFMQTFFRHSTAVSDISQRFVARQMPVPVASRASRFLFMHRSNRYFLVGRQEIDVVPAFRSIVGSSLDHILQLFELAGLYSVSPSIQLLEQIKQWVAQLPATVTPAASQRFLQILSRPGYLGTILRQMYATGVLEKLLPEVSHVRCLMQFNQYHSYTVDEHTLRAIEAAEAFDKAPGPVGAAYREIKSRHLLHLSLLLHDLGKGFEEDHSEVGRRIADAVGHRFQLPAHARETISFLVHKHLAMTNFAFRRDLNDPDVLAHFSREIGSPELLRLLYVHTAADMTAVGPGVWTEWKQELITDLYDRVLLSLSGEQQPSKERERLEKIRSSVLIARFGTASPAAIDPVEVERIDLRLAVFPLHYLAATGPEQILRDLEILTELESKAVQVKGRYEATTNTVEYRVYTRDRVGSGIFSKVTGVLTAKRLEILSANICTTQDGYIVDSFVVYDGDYTGEIPPERIDEVSAAITDLLTGDGTVEALLQRSRRFGGTSTAQLIREPTRVVIDNDSSERFTIVDVFAHDCPGLLYTIAATLLSLNLSVSRAKIATHVDQVVDVFYVTDREGSKVHDDRRLSTIQTVLCHRIEQLQIDTQGQRAARHPEVTGAARLPSSSEPSNMATAPEATPATSPGQLPVAEEGIGSAASG